MRYFFAVIVSTMLLVSGCQKPPAIHVLVIGDSYTEGSTEGGPAWPALVWASLESNGIEIVPQVSGEGDSGYVNRGYRGGVFGETAARLASPTMIWWCSSAASTTTTHPQMCWLRPSATPSPRPRPPHLQPSCW